MNRICALLLISQFSLYIASAQDQFYGTWYQINQGSEESRERMILSENQMIAERLQTFEVDEPYWKTDKESAFEETRIVEISWQVAGKLKDSHFGGEFWLGAQKGELMVYQMREPSSSLDEVFSKLNQNKFKELLSKTFYSEERLNEIKMMPSLSSITKEDLISTIEFVRSYSEQLNQFVEENKESRMRFFVGRIAESLRDRKFIELGYHPYKWEEGDTFYGDKFKDDPELKKLNEASVHLKLF